MAATMPSVKGQLGVIRDLIYQGLKQQVDNPTKHAERADDWVRMMDEYRFLVYLMNQ